MIDINAAIQNINFEEIKSCLSPERMAIYEKLAPEAFHDDNFLLNALLIYQPMQTLSASLFIPLQYLEICLRNKVHNSLSAFYEARKKKIQLPGAPNEWFLWLPQKGYTKSILQSTYEKVKPNDTFITHISLGTWKSILEERSDNKDPLHFWSGIVHEVFPNAHVKKSVILQTLSSIVIIRNRLFHYEPIWKPHKLQFQKYNVDEAINIVKRKYLLIVDFITWMSQDLGLFFAISSDKELFRSAISRVKSLVAQMNADSKKHKKV